MKKRILILFTVILLISIFSIAFIYSEGETGGGLGVGSGTGAATGTSTGTDASQQEWKVPRVNNNYDVYASGNLRSDYDSKTGGTTLTSEGGSMSFTNKGQDGKQGESISKAENFYGKIEFRNGEVYQITSEGKGKTFSVPVGKDTKKTMDIPGDFKGDINFRGGEVQQITNNGKSERFSVPVGKEGKQSIDIPGDGSKITHEPGKPWQAVVRSSDNIGKPVDIKAPTVDKKGSEKLDPVQYISDRPLRFQYGDGKSMTALPQGLNPQTKMEYKDFGDGKYNANLQTGKYTLGEDYKKSGFELSSIDAKNNPGSILVNDAKQIPKGYEGNAIILEQGKGGNLFEIQNTNDKIGYQATFEGKNTVFSTMTDKDYVSILPGEKSGGKLIETSGLIESSFTGDKNAQIKFDDNTLFKSGDEVGLYQGSHFKTDESGNLVRDSKLTTPNMEINFGEGDKSLKIADASGKIIADSNGKIVATQDGNAVRMAVVSEGDDPSKIIEQLRNHETVSGEIMDPNSKVGPSRVVVDPPKPKPETVKPSVPVQVTPPVTPPTPPPEKPSQPKVAQSVVNDLAGINNGQNPMFKSHGDGLPFDSAKHKWLVLEFSAPWCGSCPPVVQAVGAKADAFQHIKVVPVNLDNNRGLATKYGIKQVPTTVLINPSTGEIMKDANNQPMRKIGGGDIIPMLNTLSKLN